MILQDIVSNKRIELAELKRMVTLEQMVDAAERAAPAIDLGFVLGKGSDPAAFATKTKIIAEIKKASPSRGVICTDFNPVRIAEAYIRSNVAAISILTETRYFSGSLEFLNDIRQTFADNRPPLLRKDFIFDPYQVYESRACGADSLLLIAAILTGPELGELINLSRFLGMEPLVETHNSAEIDSALACDAKIIGINNRDLNTFHVDVGTTGRLRPLIPRDRLVVSESGISTREHMRMMEELEVDAVLIGEALMTASDIGAKIGELS